MRGVLRKSCVAVERDGGRRDPAFIFQPIKNMTAPSFVPHSQNPQGFTAAQIASAARLSKRWVLRALSRITQSGSVIIRGNETPFYTFDVLPDCIHQAIAVTATGSGLSGAEYLESFTKPWTPTLPLEKIDNVCIADAKKLQAALLPALNATFKGAERNRIGQDNYKREFGHEISERHVERMIARTLRRAGGNEDFDRLELYLPEHPKPKAENKRITPGESEFADLFQIIRAFTVPAKPTDGERAAIWAAAFELFNGANNLKKKKYLRVALVKFLFRHTPALAASEHALRVSFDRKFGRWIAENKSVTALLDGRVEKRGIAKADHFENRDIDQITWHAAANCGGRVAQAVRDLAASGERSGLSEKTLEIITRPAKRKSYVNRRLMDVVSNDVQQLMPFFLGKKAIDDATAHLQRDYSKLASMEVVSADDFTFPVYFYIPDGNGWFTLTRGQCLIFLDVRSWRVIAYSLQPERNYNSLVIRTLMNRVCRDHGIPGTWYFERGIWKRSLIVNGRAPVGWNDGLSPVEAQTAWEKFGVNFRYAMRARTKPVERVGGMLQDLMHGVRGYCGRDERRDCPEQTKRAIDDVQARRVEHPGELILSFEEWDNQLSQIIERYNAASQDGTILQGLSPNEAFEKFWPTDNLPAKLDERAWHLLAHYVRTVRVTANGISFRIGQKSFIYRNERTGQDRGKDVLAWFDPESPEFISVTDMDRKNPYLVERALPVDYLAVPGDANFKNEVSKAAAHSSYSRTRYHTLKSAFAPKYRRNIVDSKIAATAEQMRQQRESYTAQEREKKSAEKSFSRLGMRGPRELRPGQAEAAKELAELFEKNKSTSRRTKPDTTKSGDVAYNLKSYGTNETRYVDYLLERLTEFRKAGASFGQQFNKVVTLGIVRRIAEKQLGCNVHEASRFDEICAYLKEKIDDTILGKSHAAKGVRNYHPFKEHAEKAGAK
jgi:hypothetical protein